MTALAILYLLIITLGLAVVFYAAKATTPPTLMVRTAAAAVGFFIALLGLYLLGVMT
jgi:hypothetical protein